MEDRLEDEQIWKQRDLTLLAEVSQWEMMKVQTKRMMEQTGEMSTDLSSTATGTLLHNLKTQRTKT